MRNTSGLGCGGDEEAAAFVKDKLPNSAAYFAAFHPDGRFIRAT